MKLKNGEFSRLYPKYEGSNLGRVRNRKTKHILKQTLQFPDKPDGYLQVALQDNVKGKVT